MSQQELLKQVVGVLDDLEIAYMVTGSVTSSLQGEPRSTHEIDLVVDLADADAVRIFGAFPPDDFHVSEPAIREALGLRFAVSTPEDTILMKLRWAERSGGSEKQFTGALRVYEVPHGNLDLAYLNEWAGKLGIEAHWQRLCDEAAPI